MSPEQARGAAVDARSDIFSFGAVLYEMLSGRQAFGGATATAQLAAVLSEEPAPLPGVPAEAMRIVTKALAKKPEARYQRMEDVLSDLNGLSHHLTAASPRRRLAGLALAGAVLLVVIGAGIRWGWTRLAPGKTINSVAVLPLRNLSGVADDDWFSDGMTMTMITELSKVRTLKVISPASVMRYKKTQKSLKEIASELEVEALVEASAMRDGGRVRISAQLSDASTARILWANDYDRDMKDVLSLHRDIARAVATEVQARLNASEQQRLRPARPVKPEAMEAYLKGTYHFARIESGKALEFAEEAVKLDPDFAGGYDLLANVLILRSDSGAAKYADVAPRARTAALRADALEPDRPGTLAALGWLALVVDRQWLQAEPLLRRASEQNAAGGSNYWVLPALRGKHQEAIDSTFKEAQHDPMNPLMLINLGRSYDMARRYSDAIEAYKRILALNVAAGNFFANYHLTFSYLQAGRRDEAFQAWLETRKSRFKDAEDPARAQYQRGGWDAVWRLILQESATRPPGNRIRMRAHVFLGENAQALDELEAMEQNLDWWMFTLEDPILDPVRNEPRFQALLKRLHYPDV